MKEDKKEPRFSLTYDDIRTGASLIAIEEASRMLDRADELRESLDETITLAVSNAFDQKAKQQEKILINTFKKIKKETHGKNNSSFFNIMMGLITLFLFVLCILFWFYINKE